MWHCRGALDVKGRSRRAIEDIMLLIKTGATYTKRRMRFSKCWKKHLKETLIIEEYTEISAWKYYAGINILALHFTGFYIFFSYIY